MAAGGASGGKAEDLTPRNKTVLDELDEPYHLADSNCQDFYKNLWNLLSEEAYPNPAKIGRTGQFLSMNCATLLSARVCLRVHV